MTPFNEVTSLGMGRPHVVILGAGASLAALPNGDKFGRRLPLMKDIVSTLSLQSLLEKAGMLPPYDDFEALYSELAQAAALIPLREELDARIRHYFSALVLPDTPTLYDHLVLSLRRKDVIATFNWDPLLSQAMRRNQYLGEMPHCAFLHGMVDMVYCTSCGRVGPRRASCPDCNIGLSDVPLLYPISKKNYQSHEVIAANWKNVQEELTRCYALTFFGYGAPSSDVEAVRLIREGWGASVDRNLEEIEIIDIRSEEDIRASWEPFALIHSHHYKLYTNFYQSSIARHPRRSCEALWQQIMELELPEDCPIPSGSSFPDLHTWLMPRVSAESRKDAP